MSIADEHAVPATLAAFIYQLDIALHWLSEGDVHASVGIETLDDVSRLANTAVDLGQAKMSFSRNPLTDQSVNLWKTLSTWLAMINAGECSLEQTRFLFISNFAVKKGLLGKLHNSQRDELKLKKFVEQLRETAADFKGDCKEYVEVVLSQSDANLVHFFARVQVADSHPANPAEQQIRLQELLNLTDDIAEDVIRGLRGWIQEKVQERLSRKEPAWLERTLFCEELFSLIGKYHDRTFYLRAMRDVIVSEADRVAQRDATFVRQLRLIGIEDGGEEVLDAINDFLMSASERTRLSVETNITRAEFNAFEDRLVQRWKPLQRMYRKDPRDAQICGYELYCKTQEHREQLAGQPTDEYYFTRGTYHELANGRDGEKPILGWHLQYLDLV